MRYEERMMIDGKKRCGNRGKRIKQRNRRRIYDLEDGVDIVFYLCQEFRREAEGFSMHFFSTLCNVARAHH